MTNRDLSIPNFISLGRVILVPIVFWLVVTGELGAAFFVFVLAGASDAVDGYIAKRFGWQTELGAYLDPLADKLLIVTIFISLGVKGLLPSWLVIAVVSRDLLIVIGIVLTWLLGNPARVRPLAVSKANTLAQIVLAATVLADEAFGLGLAAVRIILVWVTGALTIASLMAYIRAWHRHVNGVEPSPEDQGGV
jgi:cardiolipin synthase